MDVDEDIKGLSSDIPFGQPNWKDDQESFPETLDDEEMKDQEDEKEKGDEDEEDEDEDEEDEDEDEEDFYTPGPEVLYDVRVSIANYSLESSKQRLERQYEFYKTFDETANLINRRNYYANITSKMALQGTQIISNRFTSALSYSQTSKCLAVGSWNGNCYLVNPSNLRITKSLDNLHNEKISGLKWSGGNLATGGGDGLINIIANPFEDGYQVTKLGGHLGRINDLSFHPVNNLLLSASSDLTWRLWDISRSQELYYQEGHTDAVNAISVQPDGSLLASAGNDAIIKLWDLRSGKSILDLQTDGHIRSVHALDWRSNGYQLASGGADSQLIIWDIRKGKKLSSVLAHSKLVSKVKFSKNGMALASVGYDGNLCLTSCDNWLVFKKFSSLDKIMALELFGEENDDTVNIVTGGWDRSIKLYNMDM